MMQNNLINIKSGLMRMNTLYNETMEINEYLECASIALYHIGNLRGKYYLIERIELDENNEIDLPCNLHFIEALTHYNFNCCAWFNLRFVNTNIYPYGNSIKKNYTNDLDIGGSKVPYHIDSDRRKIVIETPYLKSVNLLYFGLEVDDEGLPYITEAEALAICNYCMLVKTQSKVYKGDKTAASLLQFAKSNWSKSLGQARMVEKLNQNNIDTILQILTSYDRKVFNSQFKIRSSG